MSSIKKLKKRIQWEQLPLTQTLTMTKAARVQWELKYAPTAELLVQVSRVGIVAVHFIAENHARLRIGLKGAINSFVRQSS